MYVLYQEFIEPSLDISGLYVFIWICLAIVGNYFMVSLLLQFFGDTYAAKSDQQQKAGSRRNEWSSLSLSFMMSGLTPEEAMDCHDFGELVLSSSISRSWLGSDFTKKLHSAIESIIQLQTPDPLEVAALATICCDLNDQGLFERLMDQSASPHELPDFSNARKNSLMSAVLVQSGLCTADLKSQIEYVRLVVGPVDDHTAEGLLSTSVPLMFDVGSLWTFEPGILMTCQHQMDQVYGDQDEVNKWVYRMVLDVYRLGTTNTNETLTRQVRELVCLLSIHKLRIRVLFAAMADSDEGEASGISLSKFDW